MMNKYSEFIGHKFGLLTVICYYGIGDKVALVCDCGNEKISRMSHLKGGTVKSCGCLKKSTPMKVHGKHLLSTTTEYAAWNSMIDRCYKKSHHAFHRYGGRGITVCNEWLDPIDGFLNFLADIGPKSGTGLSLERIDNNLGYSKTNCIWASKTEQANNRESCIFLTFEGRTLTMMQWANEKGMSKNTIAERMKRGWSIEKAISHPKRLVKRP
jgi:hypothetical protein